MQIALWIFSGFSSNRDDGGIPRTLSCCFMAIVSLVAAAGFIIYGGRLFLMLRRYRLKDSFLCISSMGYILHGLMIMLVQVWRRKPFKVVT